MLTCRLDSPLPDVSGDVAATFRIMAGMPHGEIEAETYEVRFQGFKATRVIDRESRVTCIAILQ